MLHFHERDLAKSLISFPYGEKSLSGKHASPVSRWLVEQAVGFHHHSFDTREKASDWTRSIVERVERLELGAQRKELVQLALGAKNLISNIFLQIVNHKNY